MRLHNFVLDKIKRHLELYNFSEIKTQELDTPELELTTSDAVTHTVPKLFKVYAYTQELDQVNIKILNTNNIAQNAYFIKMLDAFFMEKLKLENYALKINFSDFSSPLLSPLAQTLRQAQGERNEHNEEPARGELVEPFQRVLKLQNRSNQDLNELTKLLQILSVSYVVDPNLKKMFTFVSRDLGEQHTFIDGECCSACVENNIQNIKATINISRLITLVEKYQNRLLLPENPTLHIVIPVSKEQNALALLLADKLQSNSLSTDIILENASVPDMMKKANKLGAKYVLIVGEEEQKDGIVSVNNMQKGETISVKQSEIISYLK
ncbi:MAG: His/Gly/Thr/Pro-type tRNA ligase C-terminal domain-containing protein [bacterium]